MSLIRFSFFPSLARFQRRNSRWAYIFRSCSLPRFFLLFSPTRAFLILKPRRVLRCPYKSDKRKATRLLNARVNVNNDNGSVTRERETASKWGVSQKLGRKICGREKRKLSRLSLVRLHRCSLIRKDVITSLINRDLPRKLISRAINAGENVATSLNFHMKNVLNAETRQFLCTVAFICELF